MTIAIYALAKFFGYSLWCYFGYRMFGDPVRFGRAMRMGFIRWLLGLGIGAILFLLVHPSREQLMMTYIAVYVPVRIFEWIFTGILFYKPWLAPLRQPKFYLWVAGGILISFAIDFLSPEMIEKGRFCVGRCLC